jgi:hypothetical protein
MASTCIPNDTPSQRYTLLTCKKKKKKKECTNAKVPQSVDDDDVYFGNAE